MIGDSFMMEEIESVKYGYENSEELNESSSGKSYEFLDFLREVRESISTWWIVVSYYFGEYWGEERKVSKRFLKDFCLK